MHFLLAELLGHFCMYNVQRIVQSVVPNPIPANHVEDKVCFTTAACAANTRTKLELLISVMNGTNQVDSKTIAR